MLGYEEMPGHHDPARRDGAGAALRRASRSPQLHGRASAADRSRNFQGWLSWLGPSGHRSDRLLSSAEQPADAIPRVGGRRAALARAVWLRGARGLLAV